MSQVVAGAYHTVALKSYSQVVAWGYNGFGQRDIPGSVVGAVAEIAAGGYHTAALVSIGCDPTIDFDGDSVPDCVDQDDDNDGYLDLEDAFPIDPAEWLDTDADGVGNNADTDDDGDGTGDSIDGCPLDPAKVSAGQCGCGNSDEDTDSDGISDCVDNCVDIANALQADCDGDGYGDSCELQAGDGSPYEGAVQWHVGDGGNGHWYRRFDEPMTWASARDSCESLGGHLATITSAAENEFVASVDNGHSSWLGGFQEPQACEPGCDWQWVTGEPWSFASWYFGEPNDSGAHEDHLHWAGGLSWNDAGASSSFGHICEWPLGAASETDCNGNGVPDSCDIYAGQETDCDGDIYPDSCEPDSDGDGHIDDCDGCADDPLKIVPGQCGCGSADLDADGDLTADCVDADDDDDGYLDDADAFPLDPQEWLDTDGDGVGNNADADDDNDGADDDDDGCPLDPLKLEPGQCGCGTPETDTDSDGVADCIDNCDPVVNASQADCDGDGEGDACELHAGDVPPADGAVRWRTEDGGNGHWYRRFDEPVLWVTARDACTGLGGHLATITSAAENEFVAGVNGGSHCWLGGFQPSPSCEPDCDWQWVTGEPWSFVQWSDGQPDDAGDEDFLQYWNPYAASYSSWNDQRADVAFGYVCEWPAAAEVDCNGNAVPDSCEVEAGTASDCDGDGVLDECEIASGADPDGDGNSVPDSCDDDDSDGIRNGQDRCPLLAGDAACMGCPQEVCNWGGQASVSSDTYWLSCNGGTVWNAMPATTLSPAISDVQVTVWANADVGNLSNWWYDYWYYSEYVWVSVEDSVTQKVWGSECGWQSRSFTVPAGTFNGWISDGEISLSAHTSWSVDCFCSNQYYVQFEYTYGGEGVPPAGSDLDGDGIPIEQDLCPTQPGGVGCADGCPFNACGLCGTDGLVDTDSDGVPDCNDADDDGDGYGDSEDAFPLDPAEWADTDGDGTGNNADADDDNDGYGDAEDNCPYLSNPWQADCDSDGYGDMCEIEQGATDTNGDGVPDSCQDCNQNGIVDPFELSTGRGLDFNSNGVLDECDRSSGLPRMESVSIARGTCNMWDTDPDGAWNIYPSRAGVNGAIIDVSSGVLELGLATGRSTITWLGNSADCDGTPPVVSIRFHGSSVPMEAVAGAPSDSSPVVMDFAWYRVLLVEFSWGPPPPPGPPIPIDRVSYFFAGPDGHPDYVGRLTFEVVPFVDTDGDGVHDEIDAFPLDPAEWADTDGDGTGNNADTDDDGDGYADDADAFPLDPAEWIDTDNDGTGNNADADDDNDGYGDAQDAFPLDPAEWIDTDIDGIGDNADPDDDGDGVVDAEDMFPLDPAEWIDTDDDGTGNNADDDDDNDATDDVDDGCPLDPLKLIPGQCGCGTADTDTDSDTVPDCGDNCDPVANPSQADCDSDGEGDACELALGGLADCNGNGVPDSCELDAGTAADCDADGELDECEIASGADPDGDGNSVPDSCDDDDGDGIRNGQDRCPLCAGDAACMGCPQEVCNWGGQASVSSDAYWLSCNGGTVWNTMPASALAPALSDVQVTVWVDADVGNVSNWWYDYWYYSEYVWVSVEDSVTQEVWGSECGWQSRSFTVPAGTFNGWISDGAISLSAQTSESVDCWLCSSQYYVQFEYLYVGQGAPPAGSDFDGDGIPIEQDLCPAQRGSPGCADGCPFNACGLCGTADLGDTDSDGVSDCIDPDDDNDGYGDSGDAFQLDPTEWLDTDGDGTGNNADIDDDDDGVPDGVDTCIMVPNPDQYDCDNDGLGNACDADDDNDLVGDDSDVCPDIADAFQADADGDGRGDACESSGDTNGDGIPDWQQAEITAVLGPCGTPGVTVATSRSAAIALLNVPSEANASGALQAAVVLDDVSGQQATPEQQTSILQALPPGISLVHVAPVVSFVVRVQVRQSAPVDPDVHASFAAAVNGAAISAVQRVDILLPVEGNFNAYFKLDPRTGSAELFSWNPVTGTGAQFRDTNANGLADMVSLHLLDGGRGDFDGHANGSIWDPGVAAVISGTDTDADGFPDLTDNCTTQTNPDQSDFDLDGAGDDCDTDDDADGAPDVWDCVRLDAQIYPGAAELCSTEGTDNDCDGDSAEASDRSTWYADDDSDGAGDLNITEQACNQPAGFVAAAGDACPSNGALIAAVLYFIDDDSDGYGTSATASFCEVVAPPGHSGQNGDCDDTSAALVVAHRYYRDQDEDGAGDPLESIDVCVLSPPMGYVASASDQCPLDSAKTLPGQCGCGSPDSDSDKDGIVDCVDATPELRLVVRNGGAVLSAPIIVDVQLGSQIAPTAGAQLVLHYDRDLLAVESIVPGGGPVFNLEIAELVDPASGTILYAVAADTAGVSGTAPATVATITFSLASGVQEVCDVSHLVRFGEVAGVRTTLATPDGTPIFPTAFDLGPIRASVLPPRLVGVPDGWERPSDAGLAGSRVMRPEVTASAPCLAGAPDIALSIAYPPGHVPATGSSWPSDGVFPVGTTSVTWTAYAVPGDMATALTATRQFTVLNHAVMNVDVSMPGVMSAPHPRSIQFSIDAGAWQDAGDITMSPSGPGSMSQGRGTIAIQVPVTLAGGQCVRVRDPVHTITDVGTPTMTGTSWSLSVTLVQGDSNGDNKVDILDYMFFLIDQVGAPVSAAARSNFNGDGVISSADFSFISFAFFSVGESCGQGGIASDEPRERMSVAELRRAGLGHLLIADLNGDGWVDTVDMSLWAQGVRPKGHAGHSSAGGDSAE